MTLIKKLWMEEDSGEAKDLNENELKLIQELIKACDEDVELNYCDCVPPLTSELKYVSIGRRVSNELITMYLRYDNGSDEYEFDVRKMNDNNYVITTEFYDENKLVLCFSIIDENL